MEEASGSDAAACRDVTPHEEEAAAELAAALLRRAVEDVRLWKARAREATGPRDRAAKMERDEVNNTILKTSEAYIYTMVYIRCFLFARKRELGRLMFEVKRGFAGLNLSLMQE